ncbi:MAG: hypothetical protein ACREJO_16315 [Phycisphaerales bacterium]
MCYVVKSLVSVGVVATGLVVSSSAANADVVFDFNAGDGGFTASTIAGNVPNGNFTYGAAFGTGDPASGGWAIAGTHGAQKALTSPILTITSSNPVSITFDHIINFESPYDGGQLQFSVNGGAFTTILAAQISGRTYNNTPVSTQFGSAIGGQRAWSFFNEFNFLTSTANLGVLNAGDTLQIRFLATYDSSGLMSGQNWRLDNVSITNAAVPTPGATALLAGGMAMCAGRRRRTR